MTHSVNHFTKFFLSLMLSLFNLIQQEPEERGLYNSGLRKDVKLRDPDTALSRIWTSRWVAVGMWAPVLRQ